MQGASHDEERKASADVSSPSAPRRGEREARHAPADVSSPSAPRRGEREARHALADVPRRPHRWRERRGWKWPKIENRYARYALWGVAQGLVAAFVPLGLLAGLGLQLDAAESILSGLASILIGIAASLLFFSVFRAISRWLIPLAFPLVSTTIPVVDTLGGNWLSCRSLFTCDNAAGSSGLDVLIMSCWALALLAISLPAAGWYLRRLLAEQSAAEDVAPPAPKQDPQRSLRPRKRRR